MERHSRKTKAKSWRRGWESNPVHVLRARNLLILRDAPGAPGAGAAGVGYSLGTDSVATPLFPHVHLVQKTRKNVKRATGEVSALEVRAKSRRSQLRFSLEEGARGAGQQLKPPNWLVRGCP
jgi:hypothetical protein